MIWFPCWNAHETFRMDSTCSFCMVLHNSKSHRIWECGKQICLNIYQTNLRNKFYSQFPYAQVFLLWQNTWINSKRCRSIRDVCARCTGDGGIWIRIAWIRTWRVWVEAKHLMQGVLLNLDVVNMRCVVDIKGVWHCASHKQHTHTHIHSSYSRNKQ